MRTIRKTAAAAAMLFCCAMLSACAYSAAVENMYALPKLPSEYESLEEKIAAVLSSGAEYAAPTSGSNLQSVQMVDLDGDGREEAVAFFRNTNDKKPIKIYIFQAHGDSYERLCTIEEAASSLYSIAYLDLNGDGRRELLTGLKSGTEVQVLAVYAVNGGEAHSLFTTAYSRYAASDMDGDGLIELTVLHSNEENKAVADYYAWNGAEIAIRSTIDLSFSGAELRNVTTGRLSGGEAALFLTGVSDNSVAVTDILTVKEGVMQNMTRNGEAARFLSLYPTDVNGDGVTEVPEPIALPTVNEEDEVYYRIGWRQYTADGSTQIVYRTFHNASDGWDLALNEAWDNLITAERRAASEENTVIFSIWRGRGVAPQPFLAIYTLTGEMREERAAYQSRFLLTRRSETVYAAQLLDGNVGWEHAIDTDTLRRSFSPIVAEWTTGEN